MSDQPFQLQNHVDALYTDAPRRLALRATTRVEFESWRLALRQAVAGLLGIAGRTPPPVHAELLASTARDGYREDKFALAVGENTLAPLYMLVPNTAAPFKTILVLHGHNPSVQYVLGNYPDEDEAVRMRAVDNNYAQALARAGYLVAALEQRGFGERVSDQFFGNEDFTSACRHLSFGYLSHGRTMMGERVWDAICAINYVRSRPDVIPEALGCTGNSGGGSTTLWLSALDERVTVSVPSCSFCSLKDSILGVWHCECNYVPGILQLAEMGDLAALIAPRPFRAIAGEQDPLFPIAAVRAQFETVQRAYRLLEVEELCSLAVHPGAHAYNHALSQEWFGQWL